MTTVTGFSKEINDFFSKSTGNSGFGHIYLRNPYWKTLFFYKV